MNIKDLEKNVLNSNMPKNIAIIMDGNGRWAKKRGFPRTVGHAKGIKTLVEISEACHNLHMESLLVYAFSTENWNRPIDEVNFLMKALVDSLHKYKQRMIKNKTRVKVIGRKDNLSKDILNAINDIEESTKDFSEFTLGICFNYGSRDEITNVVKLVAKKVESKEIAVDDINENLVDSLMYTSCVNKLDLVIRTSGELRLSNFLLWQAAYAEFVFTKTLWPDFHYKELLLAIAEFQSRKRRFGGLEKSNE